MNRYLIVIVCVLCACVGQILFKLSANISKQLNPVWLLTFEPVFILALILYGVATLGWIWCLQELPLSRAYPLMSLAYIVVPLLSWLFFKEAPNPWYFLSVFLIISGILVLILKANS
jgi:drug/metabolite transporter (DMT)-like permease